MHINHKAGLAEMTVLTLMLHILFDKIRNDCILVQNKK